MTPEETQAITALIESSRARALAWLHDEEDHGLRVACTARPPWKDLIDDLALDVLMLTTALKQARRLA